jgi:hypothetical protein
MVAHEALGMAGEWVGRMAFTLSAAGGGVGHEREDAWMHESLKFVLLTFLNSKSPLCR